MAHRRSPQIVNFSVWGDFYFLHIPKARRITSREAAQPSQPSVHAETVILVDDGKSGLGLEFTWHPETRRRKPMMLWSLAGERPVRSWQIVQHNAGPGRQSLTRSSPAGKVRIGGGCPTRNFVVAELRT